MPSRRDLVASDQFLELPAKTASSRNFTNPTSEMSLFTRSSSAIGLVFACAQTLFGALVPSASTPTMEVYEEASEKLTAYTEVPGLAPSPHFEIRVRSAATNNQWVQCFTNFTYNRAAELPDVDDVNGGNSPVVVQNYQMLTSGWSQTYSNIEMSPDSTVEVEISKIGGALLDGRAFIDTFAVHPAQKVFDSSMTDGKVYFKINNPCQVVIDINGQMDDHHAAINPAAGPVHAVSLFANPILIKPPVSGAGILNVLPGVMPSPDPATYETMIFQPGVHQIGTGFPIHPGKSYYIPGDAIVYGTFNNGNATAGTYRTKGDRIKFFGYGTLSGAQFTHYLYTTEPYPNFADRGIVIDLAAECQLYGITFADGANHATRFGSTGYEESTVSWAKLVTWRANGDGLSGAYQVEDCFIRAADDASYINGDRRRCVFWKDVNAALFHMANIDGDRAMLLENCDVIYNRLRIASGSNGGAFQQRGLGGAGPSVKDVDVTIRDFRFHDKRSNMSVFNLVSYETLDGVQVSGQSYRGLRFENISIEQPINGVKQKIFGTAQAPWFGGLIFKNISFKNGSTTDPLSSSNFATYFDTNEFANYMLFDDPLNFSLGVNADSSKGFVTGAPSLATYPEASSVVLAAHALPGFSFSGWTGVDAADANTNPLTVWMTDNRTITANFVNLPITQPIILQAASAGTWTVPPGVYSATFEVWGGGGAGGSGYQAAGMPGNLITLNTQARGGGAAGGGYASKTLRVYPGDILTYSVGGGGMASAQGFAHNSDAPAGAPTSVSLGGNLLASAVGGPGGKNMIAFNSVGSGAGGIAPMSGNMGDVVSYGGSGAASNSNGTGGGGGSAGSLGGGGDALTPSSVGSPGGAAGPGGGAIGGAGHNGTEPGNRGEAPGAGGSGGAVRNSFFSQLERYRRGGKGAEGQMKVTYNTLAVELILNTQTLNGTIVLDPPGGAHLAGTTVSATAVADPGYVFASWSGDLAGSSNPASLLMDDHKTIVANFVQLYTLTVDSSANGSITLNPPGGTYPAGTQVSVTANATPGYIFGVWGGNLTGTSSTAILVMDGNKTISANFQAAETLTNLGSNTWVVPDGVYQVTIRAWGGGGAGGSAACGEATSNTQVRGGGGAGGAFALKTFTVSPGQEINYTIGQGGLGAGPGFTHLSSGTAGGATFASLGGNTLVSASGGSGGVNVSATNANISGAGGLAPQSGNTGDWSYYGGNGATANSNGTGGGGGSAGASSPGGNAPSPFTGSNAPGGTGGLDGGANGAAGHNTTANGNIGGSPGAGGSGAAVRNNTPFTANNSHRSGGAGGDGRLIVSYEITTPQQFTLNTSAANGSITLNPPGGTYDAGTEVTVTAVPDSGYRFNEWSGDLAGSSNPTSIVMNANQSVTALFKQIVPTLTCRIVDSNVVLSWPLSSSGWKLEWSDTLDAGAIWTESTTVSENETEVFSQEPISSDRRFFRLRYP